jgi:hypothetical protein
MKLFLLSVISVLSVNAHAIECTGGEAQFIGQYTRVQVVKAQGSTPAYKSFGLKNFRLYNESMVCPLDISDALSAQISIWGTNEQIKEGSEVSGILVYSSVTDTYTID